MTELIGTVKKEGKIGQQGLFANKAYMAGEVLLQFSAQETFDTPNYLTVQIADDKHIMLAPQYIEYINHSCEPNVFFNTTTFNLEAIKDISKGEEFTFFYPSTEWKMDQPFICACGASQCLKQIQGAYYLSVSDIEKYELTDFIKNKLAQIIKKTA